MATKRQIAANRENATRSTGPKTPAGRAAVSVNALKHGLTASKFVIPGEDAAELDRLHERFLAERDPIGQLETLLVWRMAICEWQLRRSVVVEAQLFEVEMRRARRNILDILEPTMDATDAATASASGTALSETDPHDRPADHEGNGGDAFAVLSVPQNIIANVLRYRASIEGSFYRALETLERLQAKRKNGLPPIDVNVPGAP
jgi:hypothetical protein